MSLTRRAPTTVPADKPAGLAGTVAPASVEVTPRFLRVGDGYAATPDRHRLPRRGRPGLAGNPCCPGPAGST